MGAIDEYGCEFYLGNAAQIGQACSTGDWARLRNGDLAERFVGFPTCVHALDVLLLSKAIADVLQERELPLTEYDRNLAGEEGLWGAEVLPQQWVASVARVPEVRLADLHGRWMIIQHNEYGPDDDWQGPPVIRAVGQLWTLCREAADSSGEVVFVWNL